MGQLKFEMKFREKLKEREIEPKPGSWEELRAQLDSEDKRRNPILWWVGIAAAIVGGILIVGLAFINDPVAESNRLVEKPSQEILDKKQPGETLIASEETEKGEISGKTPKIPEEKIKPLQNPGYAATARSGTRSSPAKQQENALREDQVLAAGEPAQEPIGKSPMEEELAELSSSERSRGEVTGAEVDALLAQASSQINERRSPRQKVFSGTISADELLWDVQMEIEASFREKVFEVVKDGFIKARTAVANRNN